MQTIKKIVISKKNQLESIWISKRAVKSSKYSRKATNPFLFPATKEQENLLSVQEYEPGQSIQSSLPLLILYFPPLFFFVLFLSGLANLRQCIQIKALSIKTPIRRQFQELMIFCSSKRSIKTLSEWSGKFIIRLLPFAFQHRFRIYSEGCFYKSPGFQYFIKKDKFPKIIIR